MLPIIWLVARAFVSVFRSRHDLALENLAHAELRTSEVLEDQLPA
jgi:hypothetical protein